MTASPRPPARRSCWALAALVTALLALGVAAPSAGAATGPRICGQLHGPYASWVSTEPPKGTVSGTTWTVLAQGSPCPAALSATPALLAQWGRNHAKGSRLKAPGWICLITPSPGKSGSGGFACVKGNQLFAVFQTGKLSIAQLRRLGVEKAT